MRGLYSLTALVVSYVTLLSFTVAEAKSSTGSRVLVLLDSLAEKDSYTQFWHQLEGTVQDLARILLDPGNSITHPVFF